MRVPITVSSWTLGDHCSFEERCAAAANAGYDGIGLRVENYIDALEEGYQDDELLAMMKRYGIKCTEVEYLTEWARKKRTYEEKYREQLIFHMGRLFGVHHINAGLLENEQPTVVGERLRRLCQRARGVDIAVEPMPYSGISDLKTAVRILNVAAQSNAKLLLDAWHWVRAEQSFRPLTPAIAAKVVAVQVDDVHAQAYAPSVLRAESLHDRLIPDQGAKMVRNFLKMLRESGVKPLTVGVEVISDELLKTGINNAAQRTHEATIKALKETWPELLG
ncbi:sugar phosphate isomerase/epimerase family protein [Ligilactobacillus sp. LYQ139]|uniref:sugar phosphate isomerase/epimerase family protein n=1 Tax=Ligilactobacillus sp. LYQ139 TaxID=3378800 RepID=UPI0038543B78